MSQQETIERQATLLQQTFDDNDRLVLDNQSLLASQRQLQEAIQAATLESGKEELAAELQLFQFDDWDTVDLAPSSRDTVVPQTAEQMKRDAWLSASMAAIGLAEEVLLDEIHDAAMVLNKWANTVWTQNDTRRHSRNRAAWQDEWHQETSELLERKSKRSVQWADQVERVEGQPVLCVVKVIPSWRFGIHHRHVWRLQHCQEHPRRSSHQREHDRLVSVVHGSLAPSEDGILE
jgi:hypothetical protein